MKLIPAAGLMAAEAAEIPFDRIDTHIHIHRPVPVFTAAMAKEGWRGLTICVARAVGDETSNLDEVMQGTARTVRESKGRLQWAAAFDARGFERPDFAETTVAGLKQQFKEGAVAVKIWKIIGMAIRGKSGAYLLPDHPSLLRVYESIQKEGRTLVAHIAEPDGAWLPLNEKNFEITYYSNNPQWHMMNHPHAPKKEEILKARDRMLEKVPKLRVVGCHLGSNEDDLAALAKRLDRFPNFSVDCAARVRYLAAGDRATAREFVMKYQDRIVYGTDFQTGNNPEEKAWSAFQQRVEEEWRFFASSDAMTLRNRPTQGLGLPQGVLRKIYHENAKRLFAGIAG